MSYPIVTSYISVKNKTELRKGIKVTVPHKILTSLPYSIDSKMISIVIFVIILSTTKKETGNKP